MFRKLSFAALIGATLLSIAHGASASLTQNGRSTQGISHQGISHQGVSHQGVSHQGVSHQGVSHQGVATVGGVTSNITVLSIEMPRAK